MNGPTGLWRSLAARLLWEQEVVGSNPTSPTLGPYPPASGNGDPTVLWDPYAF